MSHSKPTPPKPATVKNWPSKVEGQPSGKDRDNNLPRTEK